MIFFETTQLSLLQSGLKVVKVRAEAMQEASDQVPSGLVSIMGHADLDIQLLCDNAEEWSYHRGTEEPVACVANYLFPGGWVMGGDKSSVRYILDYGKAKVGLKSLWPFKVSSRNLAVCMSSDTRCPVSFIILVNSLHFTFEEQQYWSYMYVWRLISELVIDSSYFFCSELHMA